MSDEPVLVEMSTADLLRRWRPGSQDWTWAEEYRDLIYGPHRSVTAAVRRLIELEGFGFQDHIAPILLGSDGRVWDGHHRICLALQQGVKTLAVEMSDGASSAYQES